MTTVSVSAYARLHGVSKTAAQKWQARGLLVFVDGKVDVEASDRRLAHAGCGRYADAEAKSRRSATYEPKVATSAESLAEQLADAAGGDETLAPVLIAFAEKLAQGHSVDLITAQTIKENGLALMRLVEARKRVGEVVEMAEAEGVIFEMFRLQRDAWLNFPSRVGPLIAADLGLAPDRVVEVLSQHVHQHLADLGEPEDPLAEVRSAEARGEKGMDAAA